jgi:4-hydroxybenzoyl-CoA reductase subunit beta
MEYLPEFRVHRPATVQEAVRLRAAEAGSAYLSGGTDMVVNIRRGIEKPGALIDLTAVADLNRIWSDADGAHIGAAVALADVAAHAGIVQGYPAVAQAAGEVAGPTHRAYGTIGGNLCLDTRCIYYNQSEWWRQSNDYCLKHIGSVCHVAPGGARCWAAFSGDVAPALMVHGATVDLVGPDGARSIDIAALYCDDGADHLTLKPGELLAAVHLPASARLPSAYAKSRVRGSIDFPLAGVAVALRMENGVVADLRAAVTAVDPYPHCIDGADAFTGKPMDDAALDKFRDAVRAQSRPMHTTTTAPWYRRRVVGALARRLAERLSR